MNDEIKVNNLQLILTTFQKHESKTLMKPLSLSLEAKRTKEEKDARQKSQEAFKPRRAPSWHGCAKQHGRATRHGVAMTLFWPTRLDSLWVHGCALLSHARALPCFALLCSSWCLGLARISILLLNPPKCYLFHQNPKVLPESIDKP